ncbi:MAG: hypothetical protein Q8P67_23705 [archaeon]|nr:hypothetical protein [archaeon]
MSTIQPQLPPKFRKKMPSMNDTSYPCHGQWLYLLGCYERSSFAPDGCADPYNKLAQCESDWKLKLLNKSSANFHMRRMMRGLPYQLPRSRG